MVTCLWCNAWCYIRDRVLDRLLLCVATSCSDRVLHLQLFASVHAPRRRIHHKHRASHAAHINSKKVNQPVRSTQYSTRQVWKVTITTCLAYKHSIRIKKKWKAPSILVVQLNCLVTWSTPTFNQHGQIQQRSFLEFQLWKSVWLHSLRNAKQQVKTGLSVR